MTKKECKLKGDKECNHNSFSAETFIKEAQKIKDIIRKKTTSDWEERFLEKFAPEKIWVVPSNDNVETIKEIKQFIAQEIEKAREEERIKNIILGQIDSVLFQSVPLPKDFVLEQIKEIMGRYKELKQRIGEV